MKILIASRWFAPTTNPRAFRTTELVNELMNRGYDIDAFLPVDAEIKLEKNVRYFSVKTINRIKDKRKEGLDNKENKISKLKYIIRKIIIYLFGDTPGNIIYAYWLYKKLMMQKNKRYDAIIAISVPFYIIVAVGMWIDKNDTAIKIADCGDPFYNNPAHKCMIYLKWVERYFLKKYDYITIPIKTAIPAYRHCNLNEKIRIIPQGFNIGSVDKTRYKKNKIPTFCYAGVFYEKIRNPKYFFDYLMTIREPYKFIIYAIDDNFTKRFLDKYRLLMGDKLDIRATIPRDALINKLVYMDFVVNFNNENATQQPSKLIDYAIAGRPILSFNKDTFNKKIFNEFLNGNYISQCRIDLNQYDIKNVVNQFEKLFLTKKEADK